MTQTQTQAKPVTETDPKVVAFLAGCQALINAYFQKDLPTLKVPTLTIEPGAKRYIRIVKLDAPGSSRSVYCFLDKTNGDILKAAGWKAPAKHARGNLHDENPLAQMSAYGPAYLR